MKRAINNILLQFYLARAPELVLFLFCVALYLFNAVRYQFPTGYAGLFALMSEKLASNQLIPPLSVPFYKVGGIPFAYPPLGLYLAAFFIKFFGTQTFIYLRFAPPIFTLLFLIADYFLILKLTSSRFKAFLGAGLTAASSMTYDFNVPAAGMVRALALFLATIGLVFVCNAFTSPHQKKPFSQAIWAGVFLGLTTMTHLSYAVFFFLGIIAFSLWNAKIIWHRRVVLTVIMIASGTIISSVWWGMVLARYGITTLVFATQSHGNLGILHSLLTAGWRDFYNLAKFLLTFANNWKPIPLVGLELGGLIYLIFRRRWLILGWFLATFLIIGEGNRFLVILSCIAAAEAVGDLVILVSTQESSNGHSNYLAYFVSIGLLLTYSFYYIIVSIRGQTPTLSAQTLEMADWFHQNTGLDENYLFLANNNPLGEWFPYLTERTTAVGNWGAEWTGDYERQVVFLNQIETCASKQSFSCFQDILEEVRLPVSYLISFSNWHTLNEQISASPDWQPLFSNDQFIVFGYR